MNRDPKDLHPDDVDEGLKADELVAYNEHELSHWHCFYIYIFYIYIHNTASISGIPDPLLYLLSDWSIAGG